jgi:hypothetical protein
MRKSTEPRTASRPFEETILSAKNSQMEGSLELDRDSMKHTIPCPRLGDHGRDAKGIFSNSRYTTAP